MSYTHYSFAYALLRYLAKLVFYISYKKVYVTGREHIPKNKPIIYAPNHQNALMDTMAVIASQPHQSVWLARADIFKRPWQKRLFSFLKMHPVYRIRDGVDALSNNNTVFDLIRSLMHNGKSLALFPEGAHTGRRKSIAHKKMIPRIIENIIQNETNIPDVQIIPVGIYYSHYSKNGASINIAYGEAIPIHDYVEAFKQDSHAAIRKLRGAISDCVKKLSVDIPSDEFYSEYETFRLLGLQHYESPKVVEESNKLTAKLKAIETNNPSVFQSAISHLKEVQSALNTQGIDLQSIKYPSTSQRLSTLYLTLRICILPLMLPFILLFGAPYFLSNIVSKKLVKDPIFYASANYVLRLILLPLFFVLQIISVHFFVEYLWITLAFAAAWWRYGWISVQHYIPGLQNDITRLKNSKIYHRLKAKVSALSELTNHE